MTDTILGFALLLLGAVILRFAYLLFRLMFSGELQLKVSRTALAEQEKDDE